MERIKKSNAERIKLLILVVNIKIWEVFLERGDLEYGKDNNKQNS